MERLAKGCQTAAECVEVAAEMPSNGQMVIFLILISIGLATSIAVLLRAPREWADRRVISLAATPFLALLLPAVLLLAR